MNPVAVSCNWIFILIDGNSIEMSWIMVHGVDEIAGEKILDPEKIYRISNCPI